MHKHMGTKSEHSRGNYTNIVALAFAKRQCDMPENLLLSPQIGVGRLVDRISRPRSTVRADRAAGDGARRSVDERRP